LWSLQESPPWSVYKAACVMKFSWLSFAKFPNTYPLIKESLAEFKLRNNFQNVKFWSQFLGIALKIQKKKRHDIFPTKNIFCWNFDLLLHSYYSNPNMTWFHPLCDLSRGLYLRMIRIQFFIISYRNNFSIKSICVRTILRQQYRFNPSLSKASLHRRQYCNTNEGEPFWIFLHIKKILLPFISNNLNSL